ncbi:MULTISPECIES: hypothetical protein [Pseudomonas]|uniref:Uncharacterized protein n=1 Tax=Pseudomonas nitroreducens TaxID=46680 RepID=A0A6G6J7F9_PSENT|nr:MULTISPECIES: hypothetical protein [Pseudomonas]QIE91184.1 hypothetical protein G5B91_33050 [Pseudomonas nitroreducens]UCL90240.1 hypothetical protein LDJ84_30160 [Pseudomonas sp. HS-18]
MNAIGYYPDHCYQLRRLLGDGGLDPFPAFYLVERDLYPVQQLMPNCRLHGDPLGRVQLNNRLEAYRILAGADELGQIDLASAVYTAADGQRYQLQRVPCPHA